MQVIVHADDYGLSRGITDSILDAMDRGAVTSVSIMANGEAFDYGLEELAKRPGTRLAVHLNLVEGAPVAGAAEVPLLVDDQGELCQGFGRLWLSHLIASPVRRRRLAAQVEAELDAQVLRVRRLIGRDAPLCVDSHQHLHMVPFVFRAMLAVCQRHGVSFVRLPSEPFFFCPEHPRQFSLFFGVNVVKHVLLNALSAWAKPLLRRRGIAANDAFVGVLFTGHMTHATVRSALAKLVRRKISIVEVLFHPGRAISEEAPKWRRNQGLGEYYLSELRAEEGRTLKSADFQELIRCNQSR